MMLKYLLKAYIKKTIQSNSSLRSKHLPYYLPLCPFSSSIHNYAHISDFLAKTSETSSRKQIIQTLSEFLIPYFKQNDSQVILYHKACV